MLVSMKDSMNREMSSFDDYANVYAKHVTGALPAGFGDVDKYARIKVEHLVEEIRANVSNRRDVAILDAGCGVGLTDSILQEYFPNITGCDVSQKSVEIAALRNPELTYVHSPDGGLPFPDATFDVVFAICVVHHVPPDHWLKFFAEIRRVLVPGGLSAIYEHNPWNPLTRRVVANVEFDRDAVLLTASQCRELALSVGMVCPAKKYILFTPLESPAWVRFERAALSWMPLGAQYQATSRRPS